MKIVDFSDYKFRCSAIGKIMSDGRNAITDKQLITIAEYQKKATLTEKQAAELERLIAKRDNPDLGDTCKKYLMEVLIKEVYGREKDIAVKTMKKGLYVEEDAITILSRVKKKPFKKNDRRVSNDYFIGEPDLFEGPRLMKAEHILDTKASWDLHTFTLAKMQPLNPLYDWQINGYCDITKATQGTVAYCLVDTPKIQVDNEIRRLMYQYGDDNDYLDEATEQLRKELTFKDIDIKERVHEKDVPVTDEKKEKMHARVEVCRSVLMEWMEILAEEHNG